MASLEQSLEVSLDESLSRSHVVSVAELSILTSSCVKSKAGTLSKSGDAAWYVFDDLSCDQAEDLLRQHGSNGTYLVTHFHDPESYGLSIRMDETDGDTIYKHCAVSITNREFHAEGITGTYSTIEEVVRVVGIHLELRMVPIFHTYNQDTSDFEITMVEDDDKPPDYSQAHRFPEAAKKPLPLIVPVYPTLRRMLRGQQQQQQNLESGEPVLVDSGVAEPAPQGNHGCCWKAFHTDVNGKWYKPHKAGPVAGCLLVVGWVLFLVLFGWIVGLALLLVLLMIGCASLYNFICTGRCAVEEEEGEGEGDYIGDMPPGQTHTPSS